MEQTPTHLNHLFWDVSLNSFDPFKYPAYTIGRILELGDENDVNWMRRNFSESDIKHVLTTTRGLSPRSANFWAIIYGVPRDQIAALIKERTS